MNTGLVGSLYVTKVRLVGLVRYSFLNRNKRSIARFYSPISKIVFVSRFLIIEISFNRRTSNYWTGDCWPFYSWSFWSKLIIIDFSINLYNWSLDLWPTDELLLLIFLLSFVNVNFFISVRWLLFGRGFKGWGFSSNL